MYCLFITFYSAALINTIYAFSNRCTGPPRSSRPTRFPREDGSHRGNRMDWTSGTDGSIWSHRIYWTCCLKKHETSNNKTANTIDRSIGSVLFHFNERVRFSFKWRLLYEVFKNSEGELNYFASRLFIFSDLWTFCGNKIERWWQ